MSGASFVLYGANGYTGELIARAAVERGLQPLLAGRSREAVTRLAGELGCGSLVIGLEDVTALTQVLRGARAVLHCAGPFSATAAPMLEACLAARVHYLDITGELAVFERAQSLGPRAVEAGVILCPGVGFDVVPTDCLAAALVEALPEATYLALGFDSGMRPSRGTALTTVEGLAAGGWIRGHGGLVQVAHGYREREIDFGNGPRNAVTIPWGDLSTAGVTTGIPNVETYIAMPAARVRALRRLNAFGGLLGLRPVQALLKRVVRGRVHPDDAAGRGRTPADVWGEVQSPGGESVVARIRVGNPYDVTVAAALGVLERVLRHEGPGGYRTPSQLVGAGFVETLPGAGTLTLTRGRTRDAGLAA